MTSYQVPREETTMNLTNISEQVLLEQNMVQTVFSIRQCTTISELNLA